MKVAEFMPVAPLSDAEFDQLTELLERYRDEGAMNLEELDGFLAAIRQKIQAMLWQAHAALNREADNRPAPQRVKPGSGGIGIPDAGPQARCERGGPSPGPSVFRRDTVHNHTARQMYDNFRDASRNLGLMRPVQICIVRLRVLVNRRARQERPTPAL
jgi:hypothetical protein